MVIMHGKEISQNKSQLLTVIKVSFHNTTTKAVCNLNRSELQARRNMNANNI